MSTPIFSHVTPTKVGVQNDLLDSGFRRNDERRWRNHSPGLYVHIPFCSVKCFYCDFAAFSGQKKTVDRYLKAVEKEMRLWGSEWEPATLFVGGGTPSELEADEIVRFFSFIYDFYPRKKFQEVTFEANPESINVEKLLVLQKQGVTRLSLGLQTLDAELLRSIGRRHSPDDFLSVYKQARKIKDMAICVDLMYGLPGQSQTQALDSLQKVLDLEPEHLSLYSLQVEDRTLFAKKGVENNEDNEREIFEASLEMINKAGLHHYEISNFSRPGHESIHNQNYWRNGEYLGLGCGASSYYKGRRWSNEDRLVPYCDSVEKEKRPMVESEELHGREKLGENLWLGLRLIEGFDLSEAMEKAFAKEIEKLLSSGLIQKQENRVALTKEGVFLANEVFREFVSPFLN